ncbi:condensation domain-containing protein [Micromonospora sp. NPDC093244]|uniref:condensation domain-containing protein n=1 Tax=Micromonospora sp. NPDC093244 TaxID=3155071 RepID=UPI0034375141
MIDDGAPLAFGQEALWLHQQVRPSSSAYNVPVAYRLTGPLRIDLLRTALEVIVRRQEALRTVFPEDESEEPFQQVLPVDELYLSHHDLTGADAQEVREAVDDLARKPFDLLVDRPLRAAVFRLGDEDHVVVFVMHHIVSDGWSLRILLNELSMAYQALWRGADPLAVLPRLPVRYTDYAWWQREWPHPAELDARLAYWEGALAGAPTLDLANGRPRSPRPSFAADRLIVPVPASAADNARPRAAAAGTSLFALLAAAFAMVLRRRTGESDVAFGTMLVGRVEPEFEPLIGYFVNLVVLRCAVSDDAAVEAVARSLGPTMLAAIDHEVPFSSLVKRLAPRRTSGRNPIVQVAMQLRTGGSAPATLDLPGVSPVELDVYQGEHTFDLICTFLDTTSGLAISLEYPTEVFDHCWATEFADDLIELLNRPEGDATDGGPR